jgi:hypothetical protein
MEVDMPLALARRFGPAWLLFVAAMFLLPESAPAQQGTPGSWCVLRRHNTYEPANCYEFFLCDTTKDTMRCGLAGNACGVGPMGLREGWEVDPNAHPLDTPGPYVTWQGADYVMTVLSRFSGDWYQCIGQRTKDLPRRTPVGDGPSEPGYCVLSKPIPQWPPNCFEFYLAAAGAGHAVIQGGVCLVTARAARENWTVDANMGGPFFERQQAQAAHDSLNRFAGNFYGCSEGGGDRRPFDVLGRTWTVSEGEGLRYGASFTRIGNSNVFTAVFDGHNDPTNRVTISISGNGVLIQRDQAPLAGDNVGRRQCTYQGRLYSGAGSQDLDMAEGTLDCNFFGQYNIPHNIPWRARILGQRQQ